MGSPLRCSGLVTVVVDSVQAAVEYADTLACAHGGNPFAKIRIRRPPHRYPGVAVVTVKTRFSKDVDGSKRALLRNERINSLVNVGCGDACGAIHDS